MDGLWAPWRMKYITSKKKTKSCLFCRAKKNEKSNYIILKTRYSIAMLNIFPYNNGHMMISPLRHVKDITKLKTTEALDLFKTLQATQKLLDKVLKPQGYNIGINISLAAGAGIPDHLHLHIVPRWNGDTNFMPVLAHTKVLSQSLDELYRQLKNVQRKSK